MNEMIERVAWILWDEFCPGIRPIEKDLIENRRIAKTIIEALKPATDQQQNNYYQMRKAVGDNDITACFPNNIWETMIDAILKDE